MQIREYPRSLPIFFSTELWERYGFYVVQSLLALYLSLHYQLKDIETYSLVGSFTALTYVAPIFGGFIADHWLGQRTSVLLGALILSFNFFLLALGISFFFMTFALAGVAVGTGMLKPNISSLLGRQFKKNCPSRERGFIIFYLGITAGIILGTTIPTLIQKSFGWHACFLSACIGLFVAFFIFYFGVKYFKIVDYAKLPEEKTYNRIKAILLLLVLWNVSFIVLSRPHFATLFFVLVVCFTLTYVISLIKEEKGEHRKQIIALLMLCTISVFFWTFYFQMFLSLTLFITRAVQLKVMGVSFPAPYYVAVESIAMIVFGIIFLRLRLNQTKNHVAVSAANKFSLSLFLMLIGYILIYLSTIGVSGSTLIGPQLIILAYVTIAGAELLLSPVGISAVTVLARPKRVSTMMGVFFISLGLGGFLSGHLAEIASINSFQLSIEQLRDNYRHAFKIYSFLLFGAFLISLCFTFIIRRSFLLKR